MFPAGRMGSGGRRRRAFAGETTEAAATQRWDPPTPSATLRARARARADYPPEPHRRPPCTGYQTFSLDCRPGPLESQVFFIPPTRNLCPSRPDIDLPISANAAMSEWGASRTILAVPPGGIGAAPIWPCSHRSRLPRRLAPGPTRDGRALSWCASIGPATWRPKISSTTEGWNWIPR